MIFSHCLSVACSWSLRKCLVLVWLNHCDPRLKAPFILIPGLLPVDLWLAGFGFVCSGLCCCLFVVLFFEARSQCGAPTDLELSHLLSQSPKCWTADKHDHSQPRVLLSWSLLRFIFCVWVFACAYVSVCLCVCAHVCTHVCVLVKATRGHRIPWS